MSKRKKPDVSPDVLLLLECIPGLSMYQIAYRLKLERDLVRRALEKLLKEKRVRRNVVFKRRGPLSMRDSISEYNTKYFALEAGK